MPKTVKLQSLTYKGVQLALNKLAVMIASGAAGTIEILSGGSSLGQRNAIDFGDGFEIDPVGGGVTCNYPEHVTTLERLAMAPRRGTTVYDTDEDRQYWYDGTSWVAAVGGVEILDGGSSLGQRTAIDFGDGFEVAPSGTGVTCDYPEHLTTVERLAMTPRLGTIVFDTDAIRQFWFNGGTWVEV
jgi:hypothetical protein